MKTKELIEELQKLDPEGNCLVETNAGAIVYVDRLPAYYDGPAAKILINGEGYTSGMRLVKSGYKVVIHTMWLDDLLFDQPDAIVEYDYEPRKDEKQREEVYREYGKRMMEWADNGCNGPAPELESIRQDCLGD